MEVDKFVFLRSGQTCLFLLTLRVDNMIKKCAYCGKEYINTNKLSMYCSSSCRYKVYYYSNSEKMIVKNKKNNSKRYIKPFEKKCSFCNKPFNTKYNIKKYCSVSCRGKSNYKRNKEKKDKYNKKYYSLNKEKMNKYYNNRNKKYKKENILFALKCRVRDRIYKYIKSDGKNQKHSKYILGCSYIEYKSYLESLFLKDMNWDNRNEWHIDHIIPLASAKNEEELIKLFHYSNTRPLWAEDNLKKGSKIESFK